VPLNGPGGSPNTVASFQPITVITPSRQPHERAEPSFQRRRRRRHRCRRRNHAVHPGRAEFPIDKLYALASERSAGSEVEFGDDSIIVQDLATFDPAGVDIALFSAGGSVSKEYAPKFAAAGAVVIDNSSTFRYDDDVPLVVSEVNPHAAKNRPRGIIANPNCSHHAADAGAGADPPRIRHRAHQRGHLPVGVRRRPFGDGGAGQADRRAAEFPGHRAEEARCRSRST
jgi:hypothetical protein